MSEWIQRADELVWGPGLLGLLLGTGVYLMISLKGLPVRRLKFALRCALGLEISSAWQRRWCLAARERFSGWLPRV